MSRYWMLVAASLALSVTAACATEASDKSSSDVTKGKDAKAKPAKKTAKAPRPGSEGPIAAPPPLSPSSPKLEAVEPASVKTDSAAQEVTLTGNQFAPEAKVSIGGEELKPTSVSATRLRVMVPAAKFKAAASLPIKVNNPPTNGGASNALSLTVASASAQMNLSSISPSRATAGDSDVRVTLSGTGFTSKMRARFNGTDVSTTGGGSSLTAVVPSTLLRIAGQVSVTVFDPQSTAITSPQTFSVERAPVSSSSSSCENRCVDFGYSADQCHDDWQCEADGCLTQKKCTPDCKYKCSDFDYEPNQCFDGWVCTSGCLAPKTCETKTAAAKPATTSCTYPCNGDAWSYSRGECKDNYECGSDDCLTPKVCASSTTTVAGGSCEYACNDPDGLWSYRVGECKAGYECASDGCLRSKICSADTNVTSTSNTCEYACVDPAGDWSYAAGECKSGYECGTDNCLHQKTCTTAVAAPSTSSSTCTYPCVDPEGAWSYVPNECRGGYCCSSYSNCLFEEGT